MSQLMAPAICIVAILLSACSRQSESDATSQSGSRIPDDNVFKEQVRALEKAEDVQKTLNEAVARQREAIEKQSQ